MKYAIVIMGAWLIQDAIASIFFYPDEKWRWNHIMRVIRGLMGIALIVVGIIL